jgi:hypothetical protein
MYLEAVGLLYCAAGGVRNPQCERTQIIAYFTGGEQQLEPSSLCSTVFLQKLMVIYLVKKF